MIRHVCPFPRLFLANADEEGNAPQVYCVVPDESLRTSFEVGEPFVFRLKLFSYGTEYAPYFIQAMILAGRHGLGRRLESGQACFAVTGIESNGANVFDSQNERLLPLNTTELNLPKWNREDHADDEVTIRFLTPCRFKRSNRFSDDLPFSELMLLILRRWRGLSRLDGREQTLDNFPDFIEAARAVNTVTNKLYWKDWKRWSNRQNDSMRFGGLMGDVTYQGHLSSFLPLLRLAESIQIGKQTSFGLGRISVVNVNNLRW